MFWHKTRCLWRLNGLYGKNLDLQCLSGIIRKSSQKVNSIILKLDNDLKSNGDVEVTSVVKQLEYIDPKWPHLLEGQNIIASVVHQLHQNSFHNDVNTLVNYLLDKEYETWSGLSNTILKSYIEQKLWEQGLSWFEDMKKAGQLKHLRVYNDLIIALAQDDLLKLAFHYFQEVQEKEMHMKTSRIKSLDQETLIQLLQCACRMDIDNPMKDLSDRYMKTDYNSNLVVKGVLNYLQKWMEPISDELVRLLGSFLKLRNRYDMNITSVINNKCLHCNEDLMMNSEFPGMCEDMLSHIGMEIKERGFYKDFDYLSQLLKKFEYFDYIVDAGNIMYRTVNNSREFCPDNVKNVLLNLQKYSERNTKNIALVFPQSFHKPRKLQRLRFIDDICRENILNFHLSVIALKRSNDDMVLFYLAASSELFLKGSMKKISIVSNDNFIDHRFIAGNYQHQFLSWLYQRQKKVDFNGNIENTCLLPPIIRSDTGHLHITSQSGSLICLKEK